jgi:membrane-associated phospholipid phosphatase
VLVFGHVDRAEPLARRARRLRGLVRPVDLDQWIPRLFVRQLQTNPILVGILDIIVVPIPVCAGAIVWCGVAALRGRPVSRLAESLMLTGFSATWATAVNDLMLKPLFGRLNIDDNFAGHYGFHFFQGSINSSFPSGHAAILLSLLSVFWMLYPRGRAAYAVIAVLLLPLLIVVGWHFLSDVIAGAFVGATAGLMTVTLWRARRDV